MEVSFSEPIQGAWDRMKRGLFDPFSLDAWLSIGLAAFLVGLTSGFGSGLGFGRGFDSGMFDGGHSHRSAALRGALSSASVGDARDRMFEALSHPLVAVMIMAALVFLGALLIVCLYLSARAEFVLFDQVAHGHSRFGEPWGRAAKAGRSLFLFRATMSFAWLPALALIGIVMFGPIRTLMAGGEFTLPAFGAFAGAIVACALSFLAISFVHVCTREFVVPLMAKYDEPVTQAWQRFGALLSAHPGDFIAFALMLFLLEILAGLALAAIGLLTCCVGLVLMIVPYVGSVVRLPVAYTIRGIGPLFLQQYGEEWRTMPDLVSETVASDVPPPPAPVGY